MSDILKFAIEERVARLTLNRPEHRNALSPELSAALIEHIRRADATPLVKCIVIDAEGEHFSAGGDIKGFHDALTLTAAERYDLFERKLAVGNRLPNALLEAGKPIVVATRGAVAGAGMSLCLAADFVVAAESTYFIAAHIHVGLSLDCGLSGLLVGAMGIKSAKRLALLGEKVGARESLALGIVTEVVPDSDLAETTRKLGQRLSRGPATAMTATKTLLNRAAYAGFAEQLALETLRVAGCAATEDFGRGIQATLNKKPAEFE